MIEVLLCLMLNMCPAADVDPLNMYATTIQDYDGSDLYYEWPTNRAPYLFNPWTYYKNVAALCGANNPQTAHDLFEFAMEHVEAGLVVYDYSYTYEGVVIDSGWVSGFGNGVTLLATVGLYECYGDPDYLAAAQDLAFAYSAFTTVLPDGTFWFEEYPVEGSRVLNGHIYAVWGLYYYWNATGDWRVLPALYAGAEAVARHGWDYRRPGDINLYDLYGADTPDYGPARTIFQQDQLCVMFNDLRFKALRDAFAADMPTYDKPYATCP